MAKQEQFKHCTDTFLVAKACNGDPKALEKLISRYRNKTQQIVMRYVDCHFECMDICQEIYIKLFRSLTTFRQQSAFYTWYYSIALNTIKNYLHTHDKRLKTLISLESISADLMLLCLHEKQTPEHLLRHDQAKDILIDTLKQMPEELSHSMLLYDVKGMSYEEIAKEMRCPIGTVRSRIYRARHLVEKNIVG